MHKNHPFRLMRLMLVVLAFLFSIRLGAEDIELPSPLTLRDAIRIALERNPAVKAAAESIRATEGLRLDASKRLNPAFTFNVENWRVFSSDQGPFFQSQDVTARFDYEIETAGKRELRTRAAGLGVEVEQTSYEDQKRRLILGVQRTYLVALRPQANLEVAQSILAEMDRILSLNQVRYTSGEISGGELKRSEVERLRFLDDVFAAQLELRNAKSELLALFNFSDLARDFPVAELPADLTQPATLPGIPSIFSMEELQARALRQRTDLAAAQQQERRADTETLLQRAVRSPNITVGAGYKRAGPFNTLVYGITVPLKVFNRNDGGIARAEAELARTRNETELTRTALLLEVQKAYNAVQVNQQRVRYIEEEYLQKSEQSRQIVTASYRLGEANLIDLLDAERAYRETRRIYNQALYEYRTSLYELAAAVGEEFPL